MSATEVVETKPLCSLDELLSWQAGDVPAALRCKVPLRRLDWRFDEGRLPLLVCHDMKGGYLHDRFAGGAPIGAGTDWPPPPFYLAHWNYCDVFVYFSHHFVTIPPVGWTETAHRNGVKVLGTLITENEGGAKIWSELLSDSAKWLYAAQQLGNIAQTYGFDGWLMNVESVIEYEHIGTLCEFLKVLRSECHKQVPCADKQFTLVWYDSVIATSGRVRWQDELNALNAPFMEQCDAIFLNYTWSEASLKAAQQFSVVQNIPKSKILVGIDAFGRGCIGGGGFHCDLAYELLSRYGFGAALFAPGWAYESETLKVEDFVHNLHKFWRDMLRCRADMQHRRLCKDDLPFASNFAGGVKYVGGVMYYDYADMDVTPHLLCGKPGAVLHWKDGLLLQVEDGSDERTYRLMCCDLPPSALDVTASIYVSTGDLCALCLDGKTLCRLLVGLLDARTGEFQYKQTEFAPCTQQPTVRTLSLTEKEKLLHINVNVRSKKTSCDKCQVKLCIPELRVKEAKDVVGTYVFVGENS